MWSKILYIVLIHLGSNFFNIIIFYFDFMIYAFLQSLTITIRSWIGSLGVVGKDTSGLFSNYYKKTVPKNNFWKHFLKIVIWCFI